MKTKIDIAEFLLWLFRRRYRLRVVNESMLPTLKAGDEILVDSTAYRRHEPVVGDIVVLQDPRNPEMMIVKRVHAVMEDRLDVRGDNPVQSTDSRVFGVVEPKFVKGRVTSVFSSSRKP